MIDAVLDLYHGDQVTDFGAMRQAGIIGVILKATQGSSFVDPTFHARVIGARLAGLLVGAYHFCDGSQLAAQVANFLRALAGNGRMIAAIDVEPNGSNTITVSRASSPALLLMADLGKMPVVYTGHYGPDGKGTGFPDPVLSRCPLWVAAYGPRSALLNRMLTILGVIPALPRGWSNYALWQYTDDGTVPGVRGWIDRNRFASDEAGLRAWWAENSVSVGQAPQRTSKYV